MFNPNQAFLLVQKLEIGPKGFNLGVKAEIEKVSTHSIGLQLSNFEQAIYSSIGHYSSIRLQLSNLVQVIIHP
jgi:hypothetical protein